MAKEQPYPSEEDSNSTDDFADWGDRKITYVGETKPIENLRKRLGLEAKDE